MIKGIIKDHKSINYNTDTFNKIAKIYHKEYGVMTFSGTLAISAILEYEKFEDYIMVPNNACFRVILSLVKNNNKIIIVEPQSNGFFVTSDEYIQAINKLKEEKVKISAIIVPYIDGIVLDLERIRSVFDGIIIEDIALVFENMNIGKYSDYIVTSFGCYKAVELGYGGAIYTSRVDLEKIFDFEKYSELFFLPYAFSKRINISLEKEFEKSKRENSRNARIVAILDTINNKNIIKETDFIENQIGDNFWNKFNIKVDCNVENAVIECLDSNCIVYSKYDNFDELTDLDVVKAYDKKIVVGKRTLLKKITIRINENKIRNIKSFVRFINEMEI